LKGVTIAVISLPNSAIFLNSLVSDHYAAAQVTTMGSLSGQVGARSPDGTASLVPWKYCPI